MNGNRLTSNANAGQQRGPQPQTLLFSALSIQQQQNRSNNYFGIMQTVETQISSNQHASNTVNIRTFPVSQSTETASVPTGHHYVSNQPNVVVVGQTALNTASQHFGNNQLANSLLTNLRGVGTSRLQNSLDARTVGPHTSQPGTDFHQLAPHGATRRSMSMNDANVLQDQISSQPPSSVVYSNMRTSRANVVNSQIPSTVLHHGMSTQTLPTLPMHDLPVNAPVLADSVRIHSQVLPTLNQNQSQLNTRNLQAQSQRECPQENIHQERQSRRGSAINAGVGQGTRYISLEIPYRNNTGTSQNSGRNASTMYLRTARGRFPVKMSQTTLNAVMQDLHNSMRTQTASTRIRRAAHASNYFTSSASMNAPISNFPAGTPVQGGTANAFTSNFAAGTTMNVQEATVNQSASNFAACAPGNVQGGAVNVYTSNFPADTSRNVQGNSGNVSASNFPASTLVIVQGGAVNVPSSNFPSSTPVIVPGCAGNVSLLSLLTTTQSSYPANSPMNTLISTANGTANSQNLKLTQQSSVTTEDLCTNFTTTETVSNAQSYIPQNPNILQQNVNALSIPTPTASSPAQTLTPVSKADDSTNFKIPSTTQSTTTDSHCTTASTNRSEPAISKDLWEYLYSPQVTNHVIDDEPESEGLPFWTCDPEKWKKERENRSRISSQQALATSMSSTSNVCINGESIQPFDSQNRQSPVTSMGSASIDGISRKPTQNFNHQMPAASTSSTSDVNISREPIHNFQMPASSMSSASNVGITVGPIQTCTNHVLVSQITEPSDFPNSSETNSVERVSSDVIVIDDDSNGSKDQFENPKSPQSKNSTECDDKWVKTGHSVMETNDVVITEELFEEQSQSPGDVTNNGTIHSNTLTEKDRTGGPHIQTTANSRMNYGNAQDTGHDQHKITGHQAQQSMSSSLNRRTAQLRMPYGLQEQEPATSQLLIKLMQKYQAVLQQEQAESGLSPSPSNKSNQINVGSRSKGPSHNNQPLYSNLKPSTISITQNENIAYDGKTKRSVTDLQDCEDDDMPHVLNVFSLKNQSESGPFPPESSDMKDGADLSSTAVQEEINTRNIPSSGGNEKTSYCTHDDAKTTQSSEVKEGESVTGTEMISNSEQTDMLPLSFVSNSSDPLRDAQSLETKEESNITSYSDQIPVPTVTADQQLKSFTSSLDCSIKKFPNVFTKLSSITKCTPNQATMAVGPGKEISPAFPQRSEVQSCFTKEPVSNLYVSTAISENPLVIKIKKSKRKMKWTGNSRAIKRPDSVTDSTSEKCTIAGKDQLEEASKSSSAKNITSMSQDRQEYNDFMDGLKSPISVSNKTSDATELSPFKLPVQSIDSIIPSTPSPLKTPKRLAFDGAVVATPDRVDNDKVLHVQNMKSQELLEAIHEDASSHETASTTRVDDAAAESQVPSLSNAKNSISQTVQSVSSKLVSQPHHTPSPKRHIEVDLKATSDDKLNSDKFSNSADSAENLKKTLMTSKGSLAQLCSSLDTAANLTKADSSSTKLVQSASTSDYRSPLSGSFQNSFTQNHPPGKPASSENPKLSQWLSSKRSNAIVSRQVADDDFTHDDDSASEICSSIIDEMLDEALAASIAKKTPEKSLSGNLVNRSKPKHGDTMEEVSSEPRKDNVTRSEKSNVENENSLKQKQVAIGETTHREILKAKCIDLVSETQRTGVSSQSAIIIIPKSKGSQSVKKQEHHNNGSVQDGKISLKRTEESKSTVAQHPKAQNSKGLESCDCIQNGRSSIRVTKDSTGNQVISQSSISQKAEDQVREDGQSSSSVKTDKGGDKIVPTNASKSSSPITETDTKKLKIKPNLSKLHSGGRKLTKPGLLHIQIPLVKRGLFSRFILRSPNQSQGDDVINVGHKDSNFSNSKPNADSEEKSSIIDAVNSQNAPHKHLKCPESYTTSKMDLDKKPAEKCQVLSSEISDLIPDRTSRLQIAGKATTSNSMDEFSDVSDDEMDTGQTETSSVCKAVDFHDKYSDISDDDESTTRIKTSATRKANEKTTIKLTDTFSDISDDDVNTSKTETAQKTIEGTIQPNEHSIAFATKNSTTVCNTGRMTTRPNDRFSDISDEESENPEMTSNPSLNHKERSIVISANRFSDISDEDDNMAESKSTSSQKAAGLSGNQFSDMSRLKKNLTSDTSGIKSTVSRDKLSNVSNESNQSKRKYTSPMLNSFKKSDLQSILSPTKKLNDQSVRKDKANSDAESDNDDENLVIDTDNEGGEENTTNERSFSDKENIPITKNPPSLERMNSIGSEESWPFLIPSSQQSQDDALKSSSFSGTSRNSFTSTCSDDDAAPVTPEQSGYMGKDELSTSFNNQGKSAIEFSPTSSEMHHPTPDRIHKNSTAGMTGFAMNCQKELPTTDENSENVSDGQRNIFDKIRHMGGCVLSPNKDSNRSCASTSELTSKMLSRIEISPIQPTTDSRKEAMESSKALSTSPVQSTNQKSGSFQCAKNLFATSPNNPELTGDMSSSRVQNDPLVHSSEPEPMGDGADKSLADQDNNKSIAQDIKPDINVLSQAASVLNKSDGEMVFPFAIKKEEEDLTSAKDEFTTSIAEGATSTASIVGNDEDMMTETDPNRAGSDIGDTDGETNRQGDEGGEVSTPSSRLKSLFNQLLASGKSATSTNSRSGSRSVSMETISSEMNEQPTSSGQNNEQDIGSSAEIAQKSSSVNPSITSDSRPATTEDPDHENCVTPSVFPSFAVGMSLRNDSLIHARVKMEKVQRSAGFSTSDCAVNRSLSEVDDELLASSDSESDSSSVSGNFPTSADDVTKKIGNSAVGLKTEKMEESLETPKPALTAKSERVSFDSDDELLASSDLCSEAHPSLTVGTSTDNVASEDLLSVTHLRMKVSVKTLKAPTNVLSSDSCKESVSGKLANTKIAEESQIVSTPRPEKSTLLNLFKTGTEMTSSDSNLNRSSTECEVLNPRISPSMKESMIHTSQSITEASSNTRAGVKNADLYAETSTNHIKPLFHKLAADMERPNVQRKIPEDINQLRKTTSTDAGEGASSLNGTETQATNDPPSPSISTNRKESNSPISDTISSPVNSDAVSETSDIPSDVDCLVIIDDDCDATNNLHSVHSDVINVCSSDDNPMKSNHIIPAQDDDEDIESPVTIMSKSPNLSPTTRSDLDPGVMSSPMKPRRPRKSRPVSISSSDEDFSTPSTSTGVSQDRCKTPAFLKKTKSPLPSMSSLDEDFSTSRTSSAMNKKMKKSMHDHRKSPVTWKNKNPHLLSLSSSEDDQPSTSAGLSRSTPATFKKIWTKTKQDRNGNAVSSRAQNSRLAESSDEEVDVVIVDGPGNNRNLLKRQNRKLKPKQNITSFHTKRSRTISGDKKANYKKILRKITEKNARSRSNSLDRKKQRQQVTDTSSEASGGDREPLPQQKRQNSSNRIKRREYATDDSSDSSDSNKEVPAKHKHPFILMDYSEEEDNEKYDDIVISVKHRDQSSHKNSREKDIIYDARKVDYVQVNSDSDDSSKSSVLDLMDPDVYESDSQPSSDGNKSDHETQKSKNPSPEIPEMSLRGGKAFDESSPNRLNYSVLEVVKSAEPDAGDDNQSSTFQSQERSAQKRKKIHKTISNSTPVTNKVSKRGTPKLPVSFTEVRKTPVGTIGDYIAKKYANAEFDKDTVPSDSEESQNGKSRKRNDHRHSNNDSGSDIEPMPKRRRGLGKGHRHRSQSENLKRRNRDDAPRRKENKTRRRLLNDEEGTSKNILPLPPISLRGSIRTATGRRSWYTRDKSHLKICSVVLKRLNLR